MFILYVLTHVFTRIQSYTFISSNSSRHFLGNTKVLFEFSVSCQTALYISLMLNKDWMPLLLYKTVTKGLFKTIQSDSMFIRWQSSSLLSLQVHCCISWPVISLPPKVNQCYRVNNVRKCRMHTQTKPAHKRISL